MMKKQQAWHQYWQQGQQQSCIASDSEQRLVKKLWLDWQATLPKQSTILDLATGNGAVIANLLDGDKVSEHRYIGVDYAQINPQGIIGHFEEQVTFLGEVDLANLPFADHSVDAVTSQFGFEYAAQNSAVSEIARVLRNGGCFQLIIHHANGEIVKANKLRHNEISLLMASDALIENAQALAASKLSLEQIETKAQRFIQQHQGSLSKSITGQVLESINQAVLAIQQGNYSSAKSMMSLLANKLSAEQVRLEQLLSVAKSENDIKTLVSELQSYGMRCHNSSVLTEDKLTFAWLIHGVKNG
ncbi:class I SAM-dependent methyltransferase [Thalassotalea euphylliae]|uniref:Class I SAM-dependent methyltransferase n=1 Tax=Thalassotalea euphylliae TaxID=1655234 RepID=A0A3E0U5V5_9GAMM|nr:class I SAM-dependent methyltransferase [Thalassotalea euphylliae]REL32361.1 class I SAM-dependent methyltransferase [Thalassotalea euphylliae]